MLTEHGRPRPTLWLLFLVIAALALGLLTPSVASAVGSGPTAARPPKIDAKLAADLARGTSTFLVQVAGRADLSAVPDHGSRSRRIEAVMKAEQDFANRTQAGVRALLREHGARFTPFWVSNLVSVTGDRALADVLAARPDVVRLIPNGQVELPRPTPAERRAEVAGVEWNIAQIKADRVWSDFSDTGEGVVVASIDSGVDYTHPALSGHYRGARSDGSFNHDYNWFDPTGVCGVPMQEPCDNHGHGTHTLGTVIGDDGQDNRIGVAPGATWIAAKGCEERWCSYDSLIAAGQWIVAPTDLQGRNPRPDLAPDIVNNSWTGFGDDEWYRDIVRSWVAAGIFPVYANGNLGPNCGTSGSPADYPESYAAGAYDATGAIAEFSARGSADDEQAKPDISAPGVQVRSAMPGDQYQPLNGTSMAAPHVAGTVALIWSAAPALIGDIAGTRRLIDSTAVDVPDDQCGGTAADNNVYGEGRLDAYAAVQAAPRGPAGVLSGTVTSGGEPVADALVEITGPRNTSLRTTPAGQYQFRRLPIGEYHVTISKFAYVADQADITVRANDTTIRDVVLQLQPHHRLTGTVIEKSTGKPVSGAQVSIVDTPIPATTTAADGSFAFDSVPDAEYDVTADFGRWLRPVTRHVTIRNSTRVMFFLPPKVDAYGYRAYPARPAWRNTPTELPLANGYQSTPVDLPFPFTFYGREYRQAQVSGRGFVSFEGDPSSPVNMSIPTPTGPNAAVYGFWDFLEIDANSSVRTGVSGPAGNRVFAVEWRNVSNLLDVEARVDVQILLTERGQVVVQHRGIDPARSLERGSSATVGIENADGSVGLEYSMNQPVLSDDVAASFRVPGTGVVHGVVTDATDHRPLGHVTVSVRDGGRTRTAKTSTDGRYGLHVPFGVHRVTATAAGFRPAPARTTMPGAAVVRRDFGLRSPLLTARPRRLPVTVAVGKRRTVDVTVRNVGSATGTWRAAETGGSAPPASAGAGDVLASWTAEEPTGGSGVGYAGELWLSDEYRTVNYRYTAGGVYTGQFPTPEVYGGDLAYVPSRDVMCQVMRVTPEIRCWNRADGTLAHVVPGSWSQGQMGLAYRPDDDSFYVGGWYGTIHHVQGLSSNNPGGLISSCEVVHPDVAGLAWSPAGLLWQSSVGEQQGIYGLDPNTCAEKVALPFPNPSPYTAAGLETDEAGNLWVVSRSPNSATWTTVYLVDSGRSAFSDVSWMSQSPARGSLTPGRSTRVRVTVDATGLAPGTYRATVVLRTDGPRQPPLVIPVTVTVTGAR